MRKIFAARAVPAVFILFFMLVFVSSACAVQNVALKIGVAQGVKSGKLLGKGLVLKTAKGNKISAANGATVTMSGKHIKVGGKTIALPVTVTAKSGLGWDNTRFRGSLRLIASGSGFTVVNDIDLENYLRGVLKIEMNPAWHQEALKAQAILARTYAIANRGKFASKGFDLCNTNVSQIYRGINGEDPLTDKAVTATKGQILAYGGKPASIFYHSDSGGATANSAHVWGGTIPYLKSVPEKAQSESPYANWQVSMTPEKIAQVMSKMGKNVGAVRSMAVSQRDANGRAVKLRVKGSGGTAEVTAHAFRMAAGGEVLRSTNFTIGNPGSRPAAAASVPAPVIPVVPTERKKVTLPMTIRGIEDFPPGSDPLIEMTNLDVFSKDEIYDMLFNPQKREMYLRTGLERLAGKILEVEADVPEPEPTVTAPAPTPTPQVLTGAADAEVSGTVVFYGRGWGHGVGLSQWGAKAMADRGFKCEQILAHYFPGTKIAK